MLTSLKRCNGGSVSAWSLAHWSARHWGGWLQKWLASRGADNKGCDVHVREITQERIPLEPVPLELQEMILSFNGMLARLEDAFIRLSNFSADIAHELRTPVSNLLTHTEVVLTKKRDVVAYEENLYSNLEELKRMSRMIDDMLFLAKADNGLIIPEQVDIKLEKLVAKLFDYYQLVAEDRGIQLNLRGEGLSLGTHS